MIILTHQNQGISFGVDTNECKKRDFMNCIYIYLFAKKKI